MRIEVDQSGKIEQTNMDTIIAFSDGESGSIRITSQVKRKLIDELRSAEYRGSNFYLKIFCAAVFLLLKSHLKSLKKVTIDDEYTGKEAQVKDFLTRHIGEGREIEVEVARIGRKSNAHVLALAVLRRERQEDRKISLAELLIVLKK